uniref:Uncharacterized protein n=1 Tax=Gasterosteus aculeatus TaxID=69293 RepID=G3Q591_GASAC
HLVGVAASLVCLNHVIDGLHQLLHLELVAPVIIQLVVLPVFVINNVAAASTLLHQITHTLIVVEIFLNGLFFLQLVTISKEDCCILESFFREVLVDFIDHFLFLICESLHLKHYEKSMRPRRELCDALHYFSLQLLFRSIRVEQTRHVDQGDVSSINTSGF